MNTIHAGTRLENGTYTGALGLLQAGIIDMWAMDARITLARSENFLLTTPFNLEKFGALMKRQNPSVFIDWTSLTAGIDIEVYLLMFVTLALLFFVCWLNEKLWGENDVKRNTTWELLLSLFPVNGQMWPKQNGVTRKLLMATIGVGILILSSIYTAKFSEEMMVPYPPPVFTLDDIEKAVSSQRANLVFTFENNPIMNYVARTSTSFAKSMKTRRPIYTKIQNAIETINTQNGILIYEESMLVHILSNIPAKECKNYIYVSFDEWTRTYSSLIIRKEQFRMLQSWNVIVAERVSYVNDYIQRFHLDEDCRKAIFPVYTPDPTFERLILADVSGAFAFLGFLLCFSLFFLFGEIIFVKYVKLKQKTHVEELITPFVVTLDISDRVLPYNRKLILAKVQEIFKILEE
jgi:hypothetical protein